MIMSIRMEKSPSMKFVQKEAKESKTPPNMQEKLLLILKLFMKKMKKSNFLEKTLEQRIPLQVDQK